MTIKWRDITSYSQRGPREPHWWEADTGLIRITVGNQHRAYPDGTWLMNCQPWYELKELTASNEAEAQSEAIRLITELLRAALVGLAGEKP